MKILEIITKSEKETRSIGEFFALRVISFPSKFVQDKTLKFGDAHFAKAISRFSSSKKALVVALTGDLGSGKTAFVKGFAKGLGIKHIVQSPTFILVKKYRIQNTKYKILYHIDAYRLDRAKELRALGWDEWIKDPKHIILVEWGDRIKKILPKHRIEIWFQHIAHDKRKIVFHVM